MAVTTLGLKAVGSIVKFKVNGASRNFIVAHHGRPSSIYDNSFNNGVILLMKDIYEKRKWHNSDINDYAKSDIHSYLNNTFLNLIDSTIRDQIVQVKVPYRPGSGTASTVNSGANGLYAKIFLLCSYEAGWTNSDNQYFPVNGAVLFYFSGLAVTDSKRIGYLNGAATYWWLRDPDTYGATNASGVRTNGIFGDERCSASYGVRPALVLPSSIFVQDDGTLTTNQSPAISGSDIALGELSNSFPAYSYTVTDPDGDAVTVDEKLDGVAIRSYTAVLGASNTLAFTPGEWQKIVNGNHTVTITVTDVNGLSVTRTLTFSKNVNIAEVELLMPLAADGMPTKAIFHMNGYFPEGNVMLIEACNNGHDANPAWEDVTPKVFNGQKHFFSNTEKTADSWGVKLRAKFVRGTATGECYLFSIGGAFE